MFLAKAAEAPRSGLASRRDEYVRVDDSIKRVEFQVQRPTASEWMRKRANPLV